MIGDPATHLQGETEIGPFTAQERSPLQTYTNFNKKNLGYDSSKISISNDSLVKPGSGGISPKLKKILSPDEAGGVAGKIPNPNRHSEGTNSPTN